jgi:hypothetical protein
MPRVQDAIPGNPQRAWQRRANPVLINPLHLAPESTGRKRMPSNANLFCKAPEAIRELQLWREGPVIFIRGEGE